MKNEFVATFKTSYQISPDDFAVVNPCLKITGETTIQEVLNWYRKEIPAGNMQVSIHQLEEPNTDNQTA